MLDDPLVLAKVSEWAQLRARLGNDEKRKGKRYYDQKK